MPLVAMPLKETSERSIQVTSRIKRGQIQRRFSADHVYRQQGQYRLTFKLKQKTKQVAASSTNVQVRAGVGDDFGR